MNRILLAGSAVVALALGTGSALAQSKFEIRMGGDAVFEASAVSQDRDANRRSVEFADRIRLNTVATGKADNGLQYGVRLRLRSMAGSGGSNTVDADRALIFVSGSFGTLRMGTTPGYSDDTVPGYAGNTPFDWQTSILFLTAQGITHARGTDGGYTGAINSSLAVQDLADNTNASKIAYFSPKFSGFQVGASYTPNNTSSGFDVNRSEVTTSYQDIWEVGASYDNKISGVDIKGSIGYMGGQAKTTAGGLAREDLSAFQVGARVGYAGFTLGGNYINKFESGLNKTYTNRDDTEIWSVGLAYAAGPVTVGGAYTHGRGSLTNTGTRYNGQTKQDVWALGALYTVAPGLLVGAEYNYIDADSAVNATDDKANVFMVRSAVLF